MTMSIVFTSGRASASTWREAGQGGGRGRETESSGGGPTGQTEGDGGKAETEVCPGGTAAAGARKGETGKYQGQRKVNSQSIRNLGPWKGQGSGHGELIVARILMSRKGIGNISSGEYQSLGRVGVKIRGNKGQVISSYIKKNFSAQSGK